MAKPYDYSGAVRRVKLGSPTKQATTSRITFQISMPLTGELLGDLPDWVSVGFTGVSENFRSLKPDVQQVSGILLAFQNDKPQNMLFNNPDAKVPNSELKNFSIVRVGDPDDPEVELQFHAFCPFSRDFWAWIGEMCGAEVWMNFPTQHAQTPAAPAEKPGELPLSAGDEDEPGDAAAAKKGAPKKRASRPN